MSGRYVWVVTAADYYTNNERPGHSPAVLGDFFVFAVAEKLETIEAMVRKHASKHDYDITHHFRERGDHFEEATWRLERNEHADYVPLHLYRTMFAERIEVEA